MRGQLSLPEHHLLSWEVVSFQRKHSNSALKTKPYPLLPMSLLGFTRDIRKRKAGTRKSRRDTKSVDNIAISMMQIVFTYLVKLRLQKINVLAIY
jgi:hypothetical protein